MKTFLRVTATATACLIGATAIAQQAETTEEPVENEMPEGCEVTSKNGFMRAVVCESPDATRETYILAGRAACGALLPCGAWIWPEAELAPLEIPTNHDGLTQTQIVTAKGVWVAEQSQFIEIDEVD